MPAFHQMGHDSENLLSVPGLERFAGAILSPVNYNQGKIASQIDWARTRNGFRTIFDPQLYVPTTSRGQIRDWPYFPNDVDTADLSSDVWWGRLVDGLVDVCQSLSLTDVCSPAVLPRTYADEYYDRLVGVGNLLHQRLRDSPVAAIQTAVVGLADLSALNRAMTIASILSRSKTGHIYLVFDSQTEPRRELAQGDEISGAMRLIDALVQANMTVTVGFSSSDLVLWKAAGATNCATGKFFNLRRFTKARFEEPTGQGGGQLPYWFEESVMSFLRQSDVQRIIPMQLPRLNGAENPFSVQILSQLTSEPERAWLALAWRQFMFWFADAEHRLDSGAVSAATLLRNADRNWGQLDDADFITEERRNDGGWIRPWRRAVSEFQTATGAA